MSRFSSTHLSVNEVALTSVSGTQPRASSGPVTLPPPQYASRRSNQRGFNRTTCMRHTHKAGLLFPPTKNESGPAATPRVGAAAAATLALQPGRASARTNRDAK